MLTAKYENRLWFQISLAKDTSGVLPQAFIKLI